MNPQEARALVMARELQGLLTELNAHLEHGPGSGVECARDYLEDVIALLEDGTPFPVRPPSPPCPSKRGGAVAVLRCERALAQLRRIRDFLDKHFTKTEDEPDGWCPIEAAELVDHAVGMLEPISSEELEDETPPPHRPTLRIVGESK
jgi:hypothetical protein